MHPGTRHFVKLGSLWLARGGGGLIGVSMFLLATMQATRWHWGWGIAGGLCLVLIGLVALRYIQYSDTD